MILFSHSYLLQLDPKQKSIGLPYAPLGTLQAAAVLRERGYEVSLFDSLFSRSAEALRPVMEKISPHIFVLYEDGFNYLTKMCLTNMREAAFEMIRIARLYGCMVIVSGSDATDQYEKYLAAGADYVLMGEGEMSLVELVDALPLQDPSGIAGIAYKKETAVVKTAPRSVIRDLDRLPLPAWDLIDLAPYRALWMKNAGYFSLNMATTRGCPFKCNWCAKPIYGNRYHSRSAASVVRELKGLKEKYAFDHIWFCDDIFGLKPGWVKEFATCLQAEGLSLKYKIQARADLLLEEDTIQWLSASGCENVWMGAESGSQKILDAMDKGIKVAQVAEATRLLKKHGIRPSFFIQFGYPGETIDDIGLTIQMINSLLPHEIGISVSYPLKGTVFFERVKDDMAIKTNWTDSNELALMFRNTYQPAFYRQLHRYVHRSYRKHLAYESLAKIFRQPDAVDLTTLKKALSGLYYIPATLLEKIKLNHLAHA